MSLSDVEQRILDILEFDPYINQQEIAEKLNLSRPAIANLISGLQKKGYILGKPYVLRKFDYVTCIGGANIDYRFHLKDDMISHTSNPVISESSLGGVIRNVAENLARLDEHVSLMSLVGNDYAGQKLLEETKFIMDTFAIDVLQNETTGSYYSAINPDGSMQVAFANMEINRHMNRSWILNHAKHLRLGEWMIIDTNVTKEGVESIIEFSRREDKRLVLVGVSSPKMKNVPEDLKGLDLIITNRDEAQTYFQTKVEDLKELCGLWLNKGIQRVVVTAGTEGCAYGDEQGIYLQASIKIPKDSIVDVTGAGDAFSAAVIYGLMKNESLQQCVAYGAMSAALTIQSNHAVNPKLSINLIKKELKNNENI